MKKIISIVLLGIISLNQGCRTTGQVARIDKDKRKFELQSQDDTKSSMQTNEEGTTQALVTKLEKRLGTHPRDLNAHVNLSQTYLAMGRYDQSEKSCRDALRIDPRSELARKILAQIYYRRGNLEMANIILNGLDAIRSKDSQILNLLGMIALRQNKPEFALQAFQEALKNNPSDIAVRMNLGVLYVHYRQLGLAAVEFERILKVMPEHPDANLHMAIIESNRGNLDQAEDLYKNVLSISKNNPVAIFNLAVVEERRKNFDKAIDYLKQYLDTDFAKNKNNQEVFALIEKVRSEKEAMTGKRVSDGDIMKLAAKAKAGTAGATAGSKDKEFVDADPRIQQADNSSRAASVQAQPSDPAPSQAAINTDGTTTAAAAKTIKGSAAQPSKSDIKKKKSYRSDEEEIDDLEKQLQ
jgi:Tfp pilus assembly protein PilF